MIEKKDIPKSVRRDSFLCFEKDWKIQLGRKRRLEKFNSEISRREEARRIEVGDYSGSGTGGIIRWYGILFGRTK